MCHINGVQLLVQDDLGECMLCRDELDVESSIRVPCCFTTRGESSPFCNQSLSDFARSASLQACSLFYGCMIDVDALPTNRGINSLTLPSGFPRSCVATVSILPHSSNVQVIFAWNGLHFRILVLLSGSLNGCACHATASSVWPRPVTVLRFSVPSVKSYIPH